MRSFILAFLFVVFAVPGASAKEYGNHDLTRLLKESETSSGKKHSFNAAYLDKILNDLSAHARNYPPRFDTPQDQQRAAKDVKILSGMLDTLISVPTPNLELLVRAGFLNSIGHNLDIPGAAEKANSIFLRLLALSPSDPRGNYMYGNFLSGTGKAKEALPYLEKALAAGVVDAGFSIGLAYVFLGEKDRAIKSLEDYKRRKPDDENVDKIIDAIRHGRFEIKNTAPVEQP
ncbi:MAG: hypothetical protein LBD67_07445 [Candidatus Accumulibacter sp.]|nr:hypothetical protein [Accumulibacter sp.]